MFEAPLEVQAEAPAMIQREVQAMIQQEAQAVIQRGAQAEIQREVQAEIQREAQVAIQREVIFKISLKKRNFVFCFLIFTKSNFACKEPDFKTSFVAGSHACFFSAQHF